MPETVWFWQRIVSPHMAGLAAALAKRGLDVTYVAERPMSEDRAAQGWEAPDLGAAQLRLAPNVGAIASLVNDAPEGSTHICQGLRGNGLVDAARKAVAKRGLKQWVVMETLEDSGWRGVLKRLEYRRLVGIWRDRVEGVLSIGYGTSDWIEAQGMYATRVFPFAYFLPDRTVPVAPKFGKGDPFRVLFVGQFIERKRLDLLVDAMALLEEPSIELAVIGSGPLEEELHARAKKRLGGRVVWFGQRPQHEIPDVMASADCLVLPSQYDGWGAVVSEALIAGTPAICSDRCGAAGVVLASGCGGVFPAGDKEALTGNLRNAIARGRQTPSRRQSLAAWARCLGADSGAAYLIATLRYSDDGCERAAPPWDMATTIGEIGENIAS